MITWTRLGYLVPVMGVGTFACSQLVIDSVMGEDFYTSHQWPKLVACSLAAIPLIVLGRWLNKDEIDDELHTFNFLPIEYWGVGCIAVGVLWTFVPF